MDSQTEMPEQPSEPAKPPAADWPGGPPVEKSPPATGEKPAERPADKPTEGAEGRRQPPKLRLIQCGVGGFGSGWVQKHTSRSPDFDLVAIVDIADKALEEAGNAAGVPPERRFKSLDEAMERVPADAVLTVTPPPVHVEHARVAFARGLHLMTEKPLADTLESAKLMVSLAKKARRQLVVSQNYRYKPAVQTLRRLLEQRALGEFGHGHLDFYIPADFTGTFREGMEYVLLVDMAIHHVDLIRAVTGRNIVKVIAHTFKPPWSWYQHHPGLKMLLELDGGEGPDGLPAPGKPFSYSGDWSARGRNSSWDGDWRLQCAEGSIHYEGGKVFLARSSRGFKNDAETQPPVELAPLPREGQSATLHGFAEAIRTGLPAPTSGEDNLWSFGAIMAGVLSAQQNKPVDVARLIGKRKTRTAARTA